MRQALSRTLRARVIGIILIITSLATFFYYDLNIIGVAYYPYREYALPLGILGVILIVLSFLITPTETKRIARQADDVYCSNCGSEVDQTAKFCPSCGKIL